MYIIVGIILVIFGLCIMIPEIKKLVNGVKDELVLKSAY